MTDKGLLTKRSEPGSLDVGRAEFSQHVRPKKTCIYRRVSDSSGKYPVARLWLRMRPRKIYTDPSNLHYEPSEARRVSDTTDYTSKVPPFGRQQTTPRHKYRAHRGWR